MTASVTRWLVCLLAIGSSIAGASLLCGQTRIAPTHKDMPYDTAGKAQRLDVYLVADAGTAAGHDLFSWRWLARRLESQCAELG